jgi:hypothetical protein
MKAAGVELSRPLRAQRDSVSDRVSVWVLPAAVTAVIVRVATGRA